MRGTGTKRLGPQGLALTASVLLAACAEPRAPAPLNGAAVPQFAGAPASAQALPGATPAHPYLAGGGRAAMHADGYNSDVHPAPGPLGIAPVLRTRSGSRAPGGECATHVFDRRGQLIVLCGNLLDFRLQLLDPASLELLAEFRLPGRPSTVRALLSADPDQIMSDTSGAYFYLDESDAVVIADSRAAIRRIEHRQDAAGHWTFHETQCWNLGPVVFEDCGALDPWLPWRGCDALTAVLPDHDGRIWWVTRGGRVGTLQPGSGALRHLRLEGEEIQNGFAVAADGVYIVSDHALYRFTAADDGAPRVEWREPYDRGETRKAGSISQGSGTTPTLLGDRYVAITDNAEPRIHLRVYRRGAAADAARLVCSVPLFAAGTSATDNSPIGWNRSLIVENNHGYSSAFAQRDWSTVAGGMTRIDVREDESGCDPVWHSAERIPSAVSKLSAATGLVYTYSFEDRGTDGVHWFLTGIDFASGRTVLRIPTGHGRTFDNNWASISLGPDGTAYIGTLKGLVAVRDAPAPD